MAPLCVQLYEQIPAILFPLNTCVFNSSFRSSVSTWQVRPIRNQWTMAAIMSSQHRRELLLWSTSWLARPTLQFLAVLQRSKDSKLRQSSLGLPEEQDLLSHAKVKACFESQDHKRVPCNPSVDGSEFDPQHEETSPAVH